MNYQKPALEKFGTFRDLTRLGLRSASDGASILGDVTSDGCRTGSGPTAVRIGCPSDPTAS